MVLLQPAELMNGVTSSCMQSILLVWLATFIQSVVLVFS
jgi:hypothetical protein